MEKRKLSVTLQYALRYFIVIAATILAIFLMVGWILQQHKAFVVEHVRENVENFMEELDESLIKQKSVAQEIFLDDLTAPGIITSHTLQTVKGIRQLELYRETLMLNDYLFLKYPGGISGGRNLILSSGTISQKSFLEYELKLDTGSEEVMNQMLENIAMPDSAILKGRTGENLFVWTYPFRNGFNGKTGIIGFGIKGSTLEGYLYSKVQDMPFYATLIDDSGQVLFEINELAGMTDQKVQKITEKLSEGETVKGYFSDVYESINGFTFYIILDDSYILADFRQIVTIVLFLGSVIVIAAMLLLLFVNHVHIRQIREVRDDLLKLQAGRNEETLDSNEFSQMHGLIRNIYQEQSRKTQERHYLDQTMCDVIARLLFSGRLAQREDMLQDLVHMFCPKLQNQYYTVFGVIAGERCDAILQQLQLDTFVLLCSEDVDLLNNITYLIVGLPDEDTQGRLRRSLGERLLKEAEANGIRNLFAVSGKTYEKLYEVSEAYHEVLQLTNVLLDESQSVTGQVFVYEEQLMEKAQTALTPQERQTVTDHLANGTLADAEQTVEFLFERLLTKQGQANHDFALHSLALLLESLFCEIGLEEEAITRLRESEGMTADTLKKCTLQLISNTKNENPNDSDAILDYINANFRDNSMGLETLAVQFNMSASNLSRRIKERIGENYSDYIFRIRLEEACRLLRETEISVRNIPAEIGYGDYSSFSRKFKTKMGVTLKEYRTQAKAEASNAEASNAEASNTEANNTEANNAETNNTEASNAEANNKETEHGEGGH